MRNCVVGFFDILGFRELTKIAEVDFNEALRVIQNIESLFRGIKSEYEDLFKSGLDIKMFSDNVCLSFPFDENDPELSSNLFTLIEILADIQIKMVFQGFPIRGGIAVGMHYASDSTIFSTGLVRAYESESKYAIVPRIVCHPSLAKVLNRQKRVNQEGDSVVLIDYLNVDSDGTYYINYLERFAERIDWEHEFLDILREHKEVIERNAREHQQNPKVLSKYYWLAEYHNMIADPKFTDEMYLINVPMAFPPTCSNPII